MKHSDLMKSHLNTIIEEFASNKDQYVKNPGKDFTRDRKLPLEEVIKIVLSMEGGTLNKALYEYFNNDPDRIVSASALVQQRNKIKTELFMDLFYRFNEITSQYDTKTYKGYRLYAVDGSDVNVAHDENADTYMKPHKRRKDGEPAKGYNQYHLNAAYDILNKVYTNVTLAPRPTANERKEFVNILNDITLKDKTVFIADRGYFSWNMIAHVEHTDNADYLFRIPHSPKTLATELPMTEFDIVKQLTITTKQTYRGKDGYIYVHKRKGTQKNRVYKEQLSESTKYQQWDFDAFETLNVRIVRFQLTNGTYETIYTSLPQEQFSLEDIKKLYGMRWGIETSFRELKYIIGLTNLHSKKDDFVRQEIYAKLTMYNFCERIIAAVEVEQKEDKKHSYQINYTMAMNICLDFFRCFDDYDFKVDELIARYILPVRPGRADTRKDKIKGKTFVFFLYRVAA